MICTSAVHDDGYTPLGGFDLGVTTARTINRTVEGSEIDFLRDGLDT